MRFRFRMCIFANARTCGTSCQFPGITELASSFDLMPEFERMAAKRSTMLVIASSKGNPNKLMKFRCCFSDSNSRITIRYVLGGMPVCREVFSQVTHVP